VPNPREQILEIARVLPEVEIEPVASHVSFKVRGRRFAWYLDDHHGDGRLALTCKAERDVNDALVRTQPDRYFIPSYVGTKGWVGMWLDAPNTDWDGAAELIFDSYRLIAPKGLSKSIETS
jgi:phosphoribosylglycinamide formyltransferase-1